MYCVKCGKELKEGAKFCQYCAAKVPNYQPIRSESDVKETLLNALKKCEQRYEKLLAQKECWEQEEKDAEEAKKLQEEIDAFLQEEEKRFHKKAWNAPVLPEPALEQEAQAQESADEIQYCPWCGFHVGSNNFCGRCRKQIRGNAL